MKSIIIVIVIALLLVGGGIFLEKSSTKVDIVQTELATKKVESLKKRDDALLKASGPKIAIMIDAYQAGGSKSDFITNELNKESVAQIINEIKVKTSRDVEYKIFTTLKGFVVKLKYVDEKTYVCTDMVAINELINQKTIDFYAQVNCSGKLL